MAQYEAAQKSHEERRAYPRVPLDAPFFVILLAQDRRKTTALLVDCSKGGVQLAFSPAENGVSVPPLNSSVSILGLPRLLDSRSDGLSGTVNWMSAERCGVAFTSPLTLSNADLLAFTQNL